MTGSGLVVLALSLFSVSGEATPLKLQAEAYPASTLPGLPVAIQVVATNTGRTAVQLPQRFVVEVVPEDGSAFLATGPFVGVFISSVPDVYVDSLAVNPRSSATFYIPLGESGAFPGYLGDSRLRVPASYRLRLIFDERLASDSDPVVANGTYDRSRRPYLETNDVVLTVEKPQGEDAAFLAQLNTLYGVSSLASMSERKRAEVAPHWAEFPPSRYSPHLALMMPTSMEQALDQLSRILELQPESFLADRLRISRVEIAEQLAAQARFDGDSGAAAEHQKRALAFAEAALNQAETPLGRLYAEIASRRVRQNDAN